MSPKTSLAAFVRKYFEHDAVAAAHSLETLDESIAADVLKAIPTAMAAQCFRHLQDPLAASLIQKLPQPIIGEIADKLESQQMASLLLTLPESNRQEILACLSEKKKKLIQELLTYPEGSAGRIMSTAFLAFHGDLKVKDAVQKIRQLAQKGSQASYVYVVDRENHLIGVMNMRDMMLAAPEALLESAMRTDVFAVDCFMDREKIANELKTRRFFSVPVIDSDKRLLGVVKAEKLIGDVQEEASEDIQKMFGAGGDERAFSSVGYSVKKRLPWLHVNLATAFLAASVVALFEDVIAKITVLAVYLPVVAGQGGNAGAQSLAVVMRGLVMREIPAHKIKKLIFKETLVGLMNGIMIGAVTALVAWLWQGNPYLGIVIGLGMVVNLTVAGLSGAAIPLTMKGLGLDPAQCSNIILTTVTDVMGFFAFLGFAVLFQNYLV